MRVVVIVTVALGDTLPDAVEVPDGVLETLLESEIVAVFETEFELVTLFVGVDVTELR